MQGHDPDKSTARMEVRALVYYRANWMRCGEGRGAGPGCFRSDSDSRLSVSRLSGAGAHLRRIRRIARSPLPLPPRGRGEGRRRSKSDSVKSARRDSIVRPIDDPSLPFLSLLPAPGFDRFRVNAPLTNAVKAIGCGQETVKGFAKWKTSTVKGLIATSPFGNRERETERERGTCHASPELDSRMADDRWGWLTAG